MISTENNASKHRGDVGKYTHVNVTGIQVVKLNLPLFEWFNMHVIITSFID